MILNIKHDHQCFPLKLLLGKLLLLFDQSFERGFSDIMIFMVTPESKKERNWRISELHVVGSNSGSNNGINEGKRLKGGDQPYNEFRNEMFVMIFSKDNYLILIDSEVKQKDQGQETPLFFRF
jgi:hypothetical protein